MEDNNNPEYFQRIISPFRTFHITPLSSESTILKFSNSLACQANLHGCKSKFKFEQFKLEIQYIIQVFCTCL